MEVILEFYKSNINSLSKKDKSILVQTFVYVLLSNLLIFGKTIDVSLIKLLRLPPLVHGVLYALKCERYAPIRF